MGTRSTTHFLHGGKTSTEAIIYRHWDGYPDGAGADIYRFLREVKAEVKDTRFGDPSYLAAKYVVWLANKFNEGKGHYLEFLSVGVCQHDPGDIDYRYYIDCSEMDEEGLPIVNCWKVGYPDLRDEQCCTSEIPDPGPYERSSD